MSRFFVEISLSRSIEKLRRGGPSVFFKISGIEDFYGNEGKEEEGGREYQDFPSKFLCLNAEKNRREPFSVSLIWGIEKFNA